MEPLKFVFISMVAFTALVIFFENPYGVLIRKFEGMLWGKFSASINKENRKSVEKLAFLFIVETLLPPFEAATLVLTVIFDIGSGTFSNLAVVVFAVSWLLGFDKDVRGNLIYRVLKSLAGPSMKPSKEIGPETELIIDERHPIIRKVARVSALIFLTYLWYLVFVLAGVITI